MKQQVFNARDRAGIDNCLNSLDSKRYEVVIRNARESKTLQQLHALFGVWYDYISNQTGNDVDYLHRMMKAKFLARIYVTEPQNAAQEQWVELLIIYQQTGQADKLEKHAKRISVSWATLDQFKLYMNQVEKYWINEGYPLPQLEKTNVSTKR